jgi:hypothetical protein
MKEDKSIEAMGTAQKQIRLESKLDWGIRILHLKACGNRRNRISKSFQPRKECKSIEVAGKQKRPFRRESTPYSPVQIPHWKAPSSE